MASKTKKLTPNRIAYNKELARIKRFINRAEKRGYVFDAKIYEKIQKTPTSIRKRDIESLKRLTPEKLYKSSFREDLATGNLIRGDKARAMERREVALKAAKTRKANKQAEADFFTSSEHLPKKKKTEPVKDDQTNIPETITTIDESEPSKRKKKPKQPDNDIPIPDGGLVIYNNFKEIFLDRLQEDTSTYMTGYGGKVRRKSQDAIQASNEGRKTIMNYINELIAKMGKSKLGWYLQDKEERLSPLLDVVLYDSNGARIRAATAQIVMILKENQLTLDEMKDLTEFDEYQEGYEEPE